jgi:hypothetical protein
VRRNTPLSEIAVVACAICQSAGAAEQILQSPSCPPWEIYGELHYAQLIRQKRAEYRIKFATPQTPHVVWDNGNPEVRKFPKSGYVGDKESSARCSAQHLAQPAIGSMKKVCIRVAHRVLFFPVQVGHFI